MAVQYICDGCNAPVENPVKVGKVVQREYCETCAKVADDFVTTEERIRKETQAAFAKERNDLIATYAKDGFKLPDIPT